MKKIENRVGCKNYNYQNVEMEVIKYNGVRNIRVRFLSNDKYECDTTWQHFENGSITNPYLPTVFGVGIVGEKYIVEENKKEYTTWQRMLRRCYDEKVYETHRAYKDVSVCDEWLYFPNFYEWLHSQENFDKWYNGERWAVDKDFIVKGNKIYSPQTCCLVPDYINGIIVNNKSRRGDLPIGLSYSGSKFRVRCDSPFNNTSIYLGTFTDIESGFLAYKKCKEKLIKEMAKTEYSKGNITKKCYDAMINYQVEITD